ncbi:MAG: transglutaminase-like domain-containing protein [Terriglobales bacterium]
MKEFSPQTGLAAPPPPSPSYRFQSYRLARGGDNAILATIRAMQTLVYGRGGVKSPAVRIAALDAVKGVERGQREVDSVFHWVKDNIEFRGEHAETLQEPRVTLQLGAGDCDDHSMLVAALLASLGYRVRFRTIATSQASDEFSHVFVEVQDKQTRQWIPLDTTVGKSFPGWAPEDITRDQSYRVLGGAEPFDLKTILVLAGLGLAANCESTTVTHVWNRHRTITTGPNGAICATPARGARTRGFRLEQFFDGAGQRRGASRESGGPAYHQHKQQRLA